MPIDQATLDQMREEARYANSNSADISRRAGLDKPPPSKRNTGFRGFTDMLDDMSLPTGLASLAPGPQQLPIGLLAASLAAPGGLRKLINPDEDESRLGGALQTGLSALPFKGLRSAAGMGRKAAQELPEAVRAMSGKTASTYGGVGKNSGGLGQKDVLWEGTHTPFSELVGGRGGRTDDMLDMVGSPSPTQGPMPKSWHEFMSAKSPAVSEVRAVPHGPRASRARPVPTEASNRALLAKMGQESRSGARQVPYTDPNRVWPNELPASGMDNILDEVGGRATDLLPQSVGNDMAELADDGAGWGANILADLAKQTQRLSIPARSRAYRANTVID